MNQDDRSRRTAVPEVDAEVDSYPVRGSEAAARHHGPGLLLLPFPQNRAYCIKEIDHPFRVLYSELVQRCLDAAFSTDLSIKGRFVTAESGGRRYRYFDLPDGVGGKRHRYVGPCDDPEITHHVETFKGLKSDARAQRKLVSTLVPEAGLPRPDSMADDVVQALAEARLFRLRAVLVGTAAFGA